MMRVPVLKGQGITQNVALVVLFLMINVANTLHYTDDRYLKNRELLLREEAISFIGWDLNLTKDEKKVNQYLLDLKEEELRLSFQNNSKFFTGQNFLLAKEEIENSKVFKFITKVPKGGSLHTHMLAGFTINHILNMTFRDNIYGCYNNLNIFKLKVLENPKHDGNCFWKSLEIYRDKYAQRNLNFDVVLQDQLTLGRETTKQSRETVWAKFKTIFTTLYDFIAYKPLFKEYITLLLEELYWDNVLYTELRGTFMPLYDLNGRTYDTDEFFKTFKETVDEFKESHPNFVGVKYIHSINRGVDNNALRYRLEELIYYKSRYPEFIAGFDFVGLEEDGKDLVDFHEELLNVTKDLHFFFHAGETNQFGHTDLNLADAILLNSSRIGHAFALAKHPRLLEVARERNIAVELSPISNQVLKLNNDPRNHPATVLLSKGHPVVICNDYPSLWQATGLSYDWYVVFMAMTWEKHGLKVLKKFAQNSITYSAMNDEEKTRAFQVWQRQWDKFIKEVVKSIS